MSKYIGVLVCRNCNGYVEAKGNLVASLIYFLEERHFKISVCDQLDADINIKSTTERTVVKVYSDQKRDDAI